MVSIWHKIASVLRVWYITHVCMVATPEPIQKGRVALLSPLVLGASPRRTRRQSLCWRGCSWCGYTSWPSSWHSWSWHWVLLGLVLGGEDGGREHGRAGTGDWTAAATSGPRAAGEPNPAGAHDDLWGPDSGSSGPSCASSSSSCSTSSASCWEPYSWRSWCNWSPTSPTRSSRCVGKDVKTESRVRCERLWKTADPGERCGGKVQALECEVGGLCLSCLRWEIPRSAWMEVTGLEVSNNYGTNADLLGQWEDEDDFNAQLYSVLRATRVPFDVVESAPTGSGLEAWRCLRRRFDPATGSSHASGADHSWEI